MQLEFKNENDTSCTLGTISFRFLDELGIFDKYQENHDYESEIIFKCSKLSGLSSDIESALLRVNLRTDLKDKIKNFSNFIRHSNLVTAKII